MRACEYFVDAVLERVNNLQEFVLDFADGLDLGLEGFE